MLLGGIVDALLAVVWGWFQTFWLWIVGGASALLALMFSPTLRKYTIAGLCIGALALGMYSWGYTSNHNVSVTTHKCEEFRSHLVSGPATDKALRIFKNARLCV